MPSDFCAMPPAGTASSIESILCLYLSTPFSVFRGYKLNVRFIITICLLRLTLVLGLLAAA